MVISQTRSARAEQTRQQLMAAGARAFAEKGLHGASLTKDILEPAGISVGSFYHQFDDKAELAEAILDDYAARMQSRVQGAFEASPDARIYDLAARAFANLLDATDEQPDAVRIQLRERDGADSDVSTFLDALHDGWVELISAAVSRIAVAEDLDLPEKRIAELVVAMCEGIGSNYLALAPRERAAKREQLQHDMTVFTVGGIAALADATPGDGTAFSIPTAPR